MRHAMRFLAVTALLLLAGSTALAQLEDFEGVDPLAGWTIDGSAAVDTGRNHTSGGSKALRVDRDGTAIWMLRGSNDSGVVDIWVYEDDTEHTDASDRSAGALVGVIMTTGRVLVVGPVYAPYLDGNNTYAIAEYDPATNKPSDNVTYLGLSRSVGWHRWTFDFDPDLGMGLYHNGSLQTRYKWNNSDFPGFAGVVVIGDKLHDAVGEPEMTAWVDDIDVTLGGPMNVTPDSVDLLALLMPAEDPEVTGPTPEIVPELAGVHPRLLFDADDIAAMQAFITTPDGQRWYNALLAYLGSAVPPSNTNFQTDATEAQKQGFWRLPTVALHYVLTGSPTSFDRAKGYLELLLETQHWELTGELDCGMSAGNMMAGAALAYDWLYNDLDPAFREEMRQKLWLHARRMYYRGHLPDGDGDAGYWKGDPQNNHRWHRNAGFALCTLAAANGSDEQKWLMQEFYNEMQFVADWLPEDGTSHESPTYMIFGMAHLTVGMHATDRCLGTSYLQGHFYENLPKFLIQTLTPGYRNRFIYGDQSGIGVGSMGYDSAQLLAMDVHEQSDELAVADALLEENGVNVVDGWMGIIWYPKTLAKGSTANIPDRSFFPDLGLQFVRDDWATGNAGAMFKCGPFGGYLLNKYRNDNGYKYVNVAHDDPDANHFLLYRVNSMFTETDRYSYAKQSANHNTILVNDIGQSVSGRDAVMYWWQPGGDMSKHGVVTAKAQAGRNLGIEGEAHRSYQAYNRDGQSRPSLSRYRRAFLWVEGQYVLVLDDIRCPSTVNIDWLMQSQEVLEINPSELRYTLRRGTELCPMQIDATEAVTPSIVTGTADNRGSNLGWKQLQLACDTTAIRLATVFDLWRVSPTQDLTVELAPDGPDRATVTVTGPDFTHTWVWQSPAGSFDPSLIVGRDDQGQVVLELGDPEPETWELLGLISGSNPPVAGPWRAVTPGSGPDGQALFEDWIDPQVGGPSRFEIAFSSEIDPATVSAASVSIVGQSGGSQAGRIQSVSLVDGNTRLVVELSEALSDADWYTVSVSTGVKGTDGSSLSGDRDVRFGLLAGDVNGDGLVSNGDIVTARASGSSRSDINASGGFSSGDLLEIRSRVGNSLP